MIFGRAVFSAMKDHPRSNESNITMMWEPHAATWAGLLRSDGWYR
jgi:hypothetical protein